MQTVLLGTVYLGQIEMQGSRLGKSQSCCSLAELMKGNTAHLCASIPEVDHLASLTYKLNNY